MAPAKATPQRRTRSSSRLPSEVSEDETEMPPVSAKKAGTKARKSNPPSRSASATPKKPKSTPKPLSAKMQKKLKDDEQAKVTREATKQILAMQRDDEEDQDEHQIAKPILSHLQSLAPCQSQLGQNQVGEKEDAGVEFEKEGDEGEGEEENGEVEDSEGEDSEDNDEAGGDVQDVDIDEDRASETSETTSSRRKDAKVSFPISNGG
ncbi:hypothetical protein ONZ45_g19153 [Pleurotus djamor]|nr:hypothetical protein ONZ45_g19153 [Pleurotus djamor]